ncbi:SH3 domain-containing protein Dlish [Galendromus occidentalis]|uniref:SH3 domain-containing protein Dlish n=1 Tax=Galendromus occidentalis TaxID=34638 RepID=A0AAJ7L3Y3_9ACAR|nr:SH3 domain-containing protein Dlish [Galendromus occidentalis]
MAFLCPIRFGRSRNKKERLESIATPKIGRVTGSSSIDTLIRVGLEKERGLSANSKVVVIDDFIPQVDDELGVKRGEIVYILYKDNDWIYVVSEDETRQGFIPQSYSEALGTALADMVLNVARKKPRGRDPHTLHRTSEDHHQSSLESSIAHSDAESVGTFSCRTEVHPFFKDPAGRYLVLYTFVARDENDLSVERGELVTVLNREDSEWFWVLRSDGQEGFVPSAFVYPADMIESHAQSPEASEAHSSTTRQEATMNNNEVAFVNNHHPTGPYRAKGSELVMLYDYESHVKDELDVKRGEWVYADLNRQKGDWLWVYSPRLNKYGFVPKSFASSPAMTSL